MVIYLKSNSEFTWTIRITRADIAFWFEGVNRTHTAHSVLLKEQPFGILTRISTIKSLAFSSDQVDWPYLLHLLFFSFVLFNSYSIREELGSKLQFLDELHPFYYSTVVCKISNSLLLELKKLIYFKFQLMALNIEEFSGKKLSKQTKSESVFGLIRLEKI